MNKKVSFIFKQIQSLNRSELDSFNALMIDKLRIGGFRSFHRRMTPFPHPVQLFSKYSGCDPFLLNSSLSGIFNSILHLSSVLGGRKGLELGK